MRHPVENAVALAVANLAPSSDSGQRKSCSSAIKVDFVVVGWALVAAANKKEAVMGRVAFQDCKVGQISYNTAWHFTSKSK